MLPPTPPPDIDLDLWQDSIERILDWQPTSLVLTHFGEVSDPEEHLDVVRARLQEQAELAQNLSPEAFEHRIREQVSANVDPATVEALLQAVPPEQQWSGLDRYLSSRTV